MRVRYHVSKVVVGCGLILGAALSAAAFGKDYRGPLSIPINPADEQAENIQNELLHPLDPPISQAAANQRNDQKTFKELDVNRDGVLTGTEIRGYEDFDANHDGQVTLVEFRAGMDLRRGAEYDEKAFQGRGGANGLMSGPVLRGTESYDTEGKGSITKEHYLAFRKAVRLRLQGKSFTPADQARARFWQLDGNADGCLTGTEKHPYERYDVKNADCIYEDDFVVAFVKELAAYTAYVEETARQKPAVPAKPADGDDSTEWPEVRDQAEGVVFCMPAGAKRTVSTEGKMTSYGIHESRKPDWVDRDYAISFIEMSKKGEDYESKSAAIFTAIIKVMKESGAKPRSELKGIDHEGRQDAPFGSHPGTIFYFTLPDKKFGTNWIIMIGDRLVTVSLISTGGKNWDHERLAGRFFASLKPVKPGEKTAITQTDAAIEEAKAFLSKIQKEPAFPSEIPTPTSPTGFPENREKLAKMAAREGELHGKLAERYHEVAQKFLACAKSLNNSAAARYWGLVAKACQNQADTHDARRREVLLFADDSIESVEQLRKKYRPILVEQIKLSDEHSELLHQAQATVVGSLEGFP